MPMSEAPTYIYDRPSLYPKQEAAIFHPARYAVIEASTKSGKTHGCIAWLFEQAVQGGPGDQYWWLAPVLAQARIAFTRLKASLPPGIYTANESDSTITLRNGAVIAFKSAEHPDSLYGEDVQAVVIDEATRVKEAAWHAVRSTLTATRGPVRIIGNVTGRQNWAYRLARRAEAGASDMHYARITAADAVAAGVLEAAEVEDARQQLPAHIFRQLYYAEPADHYALIYAPFSDANVTEAAEYVPGGDGIYIGYDWGFTDPAHIGLYQLRDGALYQFDELVGAGRSEQEWVREIVARIVALPDYRGPDAAEWDRIAEGRARPAGWPPQWPERAAGDPSAVQFRAVLKEYGIPVAKPKFVHHAVTSGQDVLRALLRSGDGQHRFFIHPRCTATILAFRNYRATDLGDGLFDPRPAPDAGNHAYSHGTDQARYLVWAMRRFFGVYGEVWPDAS